MSVLNSDFWTWAIATATRVKRLDWRNFMFRSFHPRATVCGLERIRDSCKEARSHRIRIQHHRLGQITSPSWNRAFCGRTTHGATLSLCGICKIYCEGKRSMYIMAMTICSGKIPPYKLKVTVFQIPPTFSTQFSFCSTLHVLSYEPAP